jgi:hypothetical protein
MDLTEFHASLKQLSVDDIHGVARSLASDTAGDEVDAWHATIAIDRALRHSHRTHVARAAAEVARGMTAGDDCVFEVHHLLQHWFPVLARA